MVILIIGGSGSGKSAYAEKRTEELAGKGGGKYYLATMAVRDEEMKRKVARHRRIRAGKGWYTLEYPTDAGAAAGIIVSSGPEREAANDSRRTSSECEIGSGQESRLKSGSVVLLEDLGNLAANEMFRSRRRRSADKTAEKIYADLRKLEEVAHALVIVSNDVFRDGIRYDAGTQEYICAMGILHREIAVRASEVTEVVAGIPIRVKCGKRGSPEKMEIIVGGQAQGKLAIAQREHPDYTLTKGEVTEFPSDLWLGSGQFRLILNHVHILIRRMLERGYSQEKILEEFAVLEEKTSGLVLIFDEIGSGIVPMDPFERKWREVTGRVMTALAGQADRVERVVCGIPQSLK